MGFLRKLLDAFVPDPGRTPDQLARWLDLPEQDLRAWLNGPPNAAYSYRAFRIPKRRGGERLIHAPSDDLKTLQRRILGKLLTKLPVHRSAKGFVCGRSIVDNARPHVGQAVVINLDLADFFPTISKDRVVAAWRGLGWNKDAARILANICTHEGRLPQGAPTSPALSNLVCRKLDARLAALAEKLQTRFQSERQAEAMPLRANYTRYADDLTFSFARFGYNKARINRPPGTKSRKKQKAIGRTILHLIRKIIEDEGFRIQKKKRVRIQRAHQRQTATGLVVNRGVNLPRETRRRIRAMQHQDRQGKLTPSQKKELAGWEAFAEMVRNQADKHY